MTGKLLILGSDYGTIQVVKEAQKCGLYVIVADLMENSPTKKLADEAWLISTTDLDLLEQKCRSENVSAIMFGASDFNISNCRELCKHLNLPIYCNDDLAWERVRDKSCFKKICKEVGAPVAKDFIISQQMTDEELASVVFPVVVKPSDKSGNRGMSFCNNKKELLDAYKLALDVSDNRKIIVEKKLNGPEFNVHYVLADGKASLLYFSSTHHQEGESSNLYSFKCTTSNHLKQYIKEVDVYVKRVFEKIGCKEGIAWVDIMRDDDGKFYLLEMGHRFGGVMTYAPYEKVSGFNTVKWMLECAVGKKHTSEDLPPDLDCAYTACAASYHLFTTQEATVGRIEGLEEIKKIPGVYIDMPKRENSNVKKNVCMGLIGIYAENVDGLCNTLKNINDVLKIKNKCGDDIIIYFDGYDKIIREYNVGLIDFSKGNER